MEKKHKSWWKTAYVISYSSHSYSINKCVKLMFKLIEVLFNICIHQYIEIVPILCHLLTPHIIMFCTGNHHFITKHKQGISHIWWYKPIQAQSILQTNKLLCFTNSRNISSPSVLIVYTCTTSWPFTTMLCVLWSITTHITEHRSWKIKHEMFG